MKEGITLNKKFAGITFHEVVENYSDTLIRVAFQNTKTISDAEDIVQEVYMKLIKHHQRFQSMEHLKAWLIRVTINKCKDHFKSAWFRKTTALTEKMTFFAKEENELMDELFELEPEDRNIIYLYYYEGYSIKEISSIVNKNQNTISSRLQRARTKLKLLLEEGRVV